MDQPCIISDIMTVEEYCNPSLATIDCHSDWSNRSCQHALVDQPCKSLDINKPCIIPDIMTVEEYRDHFINCHSVH